MSLDKRQFQFFHVSVCKILFQEKIFPEKYFLTFINKYGSFLFLVNK